MCSQKWITSACMPPDCLNEKVQNRPILHFAKINSVSRPKVYKWSVPTTQHMKNRVIMLGERPWAILIAGALSRVLLTQGFLQLGGSDRPLITNQFTPNQDKNLQCSNNNLWYIYSLEVFYDVNSWQLFMISMYSTMVQMVIFFAVEVKFCGCKDSSGHCSSSEYWYFCWNVLILNICVNDREYAENSFLGHQKVYAQKRSQTSPLNQKATPATFLTSSISAETYNSLIEVCVTFPLSEQAVIVSLFYLFWVYICMHRNNNVIENSIGLCGFTF